MIEGDLVDVLLDFVELGRLTFEKDHIRVTGTGQQTDWPSIVLGGQYAITTYYVNPT